MGKASSVEDLSGSSCRQTPSSINGKTLPNGVVHSNGTSGRLRNRSRSRKTMLGRSIVMYEKDFKPQEWDGSELISNHENSLNECKEAYQADSYIEGLSPPRCYRPMVKKESPSGATAKFYKQFGLYWTIFPKTDYTYSPSSPYHGMEVAPGIPVIPNLSRRSLHSRSSFQKATTAVTTVWTTFYKTVKVTVETVITTFLGTRDSTHESRSPWLRFLCILLLLLPFLYYLFLSDSYHENGILKDNESYLFAPAKKVWTVVSSFIEILFRTIYMIPTLSLQILYLVQSFILSSLESMRVNSSSSGNGRPTPKLIDSYSDQSKSNSPLNEYEVRKIVLAILKEREPQVSGDLDLRFQKFTTVLETLVNEEVTILNMKMQEEMRHVIREGIKNSPFPSDKVKEIVNEVIQENEYKFEARIKDLVEKYVLEATSKNNDILGDDVPSLRKEEIERLIAVSSLKTYTDMKILFNTFAKHLRADVMSAAVQNKNDLLTLNLEVDHLKNSKEDLLKKMSALTALLTILQEKMKSLEETNLQVQMKGEEKSMENKGGFANMTDLAGLHEFVLSNIKSVLSKYHADRTGKPDYALLTSGGQVVDIKCTSYYSGFGSVYLGNWSWLKLWDLKASPNTILQPGIMPGECWPFEGASGFFVIKLADTIKVEGFTLEHMPKELSIYGHIDSAPKDFSVYAVTSEDDPEHFLLGKFQFLDNGESLQYFEAVDYPHPVSFVGLRVETNHGNLDYTCLYRFRVHGRKWASEE